MLDRPVFPVRLSTKLSARNLLHDAKEVVARRDRNLDVPILRRDRLGRLRHMFVVRHHNEASP